MPAVAMEKLPKKLTAQVNLSLKNDDMLNEIFFQIFHLAPESPNRAQLIIKAAKSNWEWL